MYDFAPFYEISQKIEGSRSDQDRIKWCEDGLALLRPFVAACLERDGWLPPVIHCRDTAPWLYMKYGGWADAERVIRFCMTCHAYYPDTGEEVLQWLFSFRDAAEAVCAYVKAHPGVLQKDIYKHLDGVAERGSLRSVLRSYKGLRKEKHGKTNRLYLKEV